MLVTDRHATGGRDLADVVSEAVAGGVGLVQVRERDLPVDELERLLHRLLARLHGAPARLLVNGSPTLAHALGIGLHLAARVGPLDGPRPRLYGRAVHDEAEARRALAERVSHVVAGPVYPTRSKPGHPGLGASGLAALARAVAPVPLFAIGGLTPERVAPVVRAGAHGVAVRGAILGAATPRVAARDFTRALARAGTAPGGPGAGR